MAWFLPPRESDCSDSMLTMLMTRKGSPSLSCMGVGTGWGPTLAGSATFSGLAMGGVVAPYRVEGEAKVTECRLESLMLIFLQFSRGVLSPRL